MVCNKTLPWTNIMDTMRCEKKWMIMYQQYFQHTVTIIKHCDHNYEVSWSICNPVRLALIWPDNSFEEICKWEIGASNYLDVSCMHFLLQDDFPTLLPSQASFPVQFCFQVKRDSFHNPSIPGYTWKWMFFAKI